MAELRLTNIPDNLLHFIKLHAETLGRSVEDVAREALERGMRMDVKGRVAVAERIRNMTPGPIEDDSTDIIRRMRDGS